MKSKKHIKIKIAYWVRLLTQKFFTFFVLFILLMAFFYIRLLWKPVNLHFLETYLETALSTSDYDIDLEGARIVNNKDVSLLGIEIDKVTINNTQTSEKHFLHTILLDISKTSLLQGGFGINKIFINDIKSLPNLKLTPINKKSSNENININKIHENFSIYKILNHYLHVPLMRPFKELIVKKSNLKFNIPTFNNEALHVRGKFVHVRRLKDHITIILDASISNSFIGQDPLNTYIETHYDLNKHKTFDVNLKIGTLQKRHHFQNNMGSGKVLLNANAKINDDLTFNQLDTKLFVKNWNVPKSDINTEQLKIKKAVVQFNYVPKKRQFIVNMPEMISNKGDLNGHIKLKDDGQINVKINADNFYDGIVFKQDIGLKTINLTGHFNDIKNHLTINHYDIKFKKKTYISGDGEYNINAQDYVINTKIDNLTLEHLMTLWPNNASQGARYWASENLKAAHFGTVKFNALGTLKKSYPEKIFLNAPLINSVFSYLKPMKDATQASGYLQIDDKKFTAFVDRAKIGTLNVKDTYFEIPNIMQPIPHAYIKANISGGLREGLTLINSKPLYLMNKGGFGYQQSTGYFSGVLNLDFELLKVVKLDAINMRSNIAIKNGSLKVGKKQIPLKNINAKLLVTPDKATGSGILSTYGLKSNFKLIEKFTQKERITTDIKLKSTITHKQFLNALPFLLDTEFPFHEYFFGLASFNTHLQLGRSGIRKLNVQGDFSKMRVGFDNSLWQVPINEKKTLKLSGHHQGDIFKITEMTFNHKDFRAYFTNMNIDNGIQDFQINHLTFKDILHNATGFYKLKKNNRYDIHLKANSLSFLPIIEFEKNFKAFSVIKHRKEYPNFMIDLYANKLKLYDKVKVEKVHINAVRDFDNIHQIIAKIQAPTMKITDIVINELAPHHRNIIVKAKHAGNLITQLGLFEKFKGGNLVIDMTQKPKKVEGTLKITKGTVLKAPLIAKLFSFASLSAITDRLSSRGLMIDTVKAKFIKKNGIIRYMNGLMHGSAIGMSFQGTYNSNLKTLDMYGSVTPFYGLNSLLSNIPVIGKITSSRRGEGIVSISYKMRGKSAKPEITIEPLSILSIGILRRLFE